MSFSTREFISGHRLPNQDASYIRVTEEDRLTQYVKAIPLLTISDNQRLAQENQDLKTVQAQEIDRLKVQLHEKEQQLRQTVEALEIKSKNSIDKIEKQILKLNDMIVEVTTDHEHGGTHYYKYEKA